MNPNGQIPMAAAPQHPLQQPVPPPPPPQQKQPQPQPPAPGAFGLPAPPASTSVGGPYRQYYNAAGNDPFLGLYTSAYAEFNVPLAGPVLNTPAELATKVYQAGEQGYAMAFVLLTRPSNAPAEEIGEINAYHCVSKFSPRIGMVPTAWDDVTFAFSRGYDARTSSYLSRLAGFLLPHRIHYSSPHCSSDGPASSYPSG